MQPNTTSTNAAYGPVSGARLLVGTYPPREESKALALGNATKGMPPISQPPI